MKKFLFVILVIALFAVAFVPLQEQIDQFIKSAQTTSVPGSTQDTVTSDAITTGINPARNIPRLSSSVTSLPFGSCSGQADSVF